jgi:cytochrome c
MNRFKRSAIYGSILASAAAVAIGAALTSGPSVEKIARAMTGGDPSRAPDLIRRYGCAGCHTIRGIPGSDGQVGGPLVDLRRRVFVGGVAPNTPANLIQWIVAPQSFSPRTAMPASGISEAEARDVAAYLYSR